MDRVAIFGDSFVDPYYNKELDQDSGYSWVHLLADKYITHNAGASGTGPDYSFTRLRHWRNPQVEQGLTQDTSLIFVCSDPCRMDLSCWEDPREAVEIFDIAQGHTEHKSSMFAKQALQWMITDEWLINQSLLYYLALNSLSEHFKRVLFWPVGNTVHYKMFNQLPSADNFYFVDQGLNDITIQDCGESIYGQGLDTRINHLQKANHDIMYNSLVQWIEHGTPVDTSKFIFAGPLLRS